MSIKYTCMGYWADCDTPALPNEKFCYKCLDEIKFQEDSNKEQDAQRLKQLN